MKLTVMLFTCALFVRPSLAQNSDLGILGGVNAPAAKVSVGSIVAVESSVGGSFQFNYAWQLRKAHIADMYLELPFVVAGRDSTVFSDRVYNFGGANLFFTPGIRMKLHLQPRLALYGAAGAGVASFFSTLRVSGSSVTVAVKRTGTIAADFGGGLDFRLTRLLSLRVEGRDFVGGGKLGGDVGYHHVIVQCGLAFHF